MELGHDVKAQLNIYMQTVDIRNFTYTLKNTKVTLTSLQEPSGSNIFHDISECIVRESNLIEFLGILVSEFTDRYFDDSPEMIKSMLNQPAGREKHTPLMCAVKHNRKRLLKELVDLGGDIGLKDNLSHSLVHMAATNGFDSILVYLCMEKGMSYLETDSNLRNPLHLAALDNQVNTGLLLIVWIKEYYPEKLDDKDWSGSTAMHYAANSQCYKIIRNLLIVGASKDIVDAKGDTALSIAVSKADDPIVKLLVSFT